MGDAGQWEFPGAGGLPGTGSYGAGAKGKPLPFGAFLMVNFCLSFLFRLRGGVPLGELAGAALLA